MNGRGDKAKELAQMMVKQAKFLKLAGLFSEAHELARRALAIRSMGQDYNRILTNARVQPVPVRINRRQWR